MNDNAPKLRRGWTTGACATAALKAALLRLWGGSAPERVRITLPRGERAEFAVAFCQAGPDRAVNCAPNWAEAGVIKDAGDDPDVTHGAMIRARVVPGGRGVRFVAGEGVGVVTRPGLPVAVGEAAINPVPRAMMGQVVEELAAMYGQAANAEIILSIPGGAALAAKTWNPRLGIRGGLSILGTTGIVRPFSCAAWIASIHRGIDVARASGLAHVAGTTGATSEAAVQALYDLPDHAMLDMGDFVGGLVKYLRRHPVARLSIGGGLAKLTKLGQGALDLHSGRSQVDFASLADWLKDGEVANMNTVLQVYEKHEKKLSDIVAKKALCRLEILLREAPVAVDVVVVDRAGKVVGRAGVRDVAP